jgi:hypothetical protein
MKMKEFPKDIPKVGELFNAFLKVEVPHKKHAAAPFVRAKPFKGDNKKYVYADVWQFNPKLWYFRPAASP